MQSVCHLAAPRGHWICIWDAAQQQKYAASVDERLHTHAHCLQPSLFAYWLWSCVVTVLILLTKYWRPRDVTLLNYFLKPRGITSACWKCSTDGRSISLAATIRPPPTLPLPTPEVDPHNSQYRNDSYRCTGGLLRPCHLYYLCGQVHMLQITLSPYGGWWPNLIAPKLNS